MSQRPARVLVVDDSENIRALIAVNLEMEGFEVVTAVDGYDALAKAQDLAPDCITLDVVMPGLDGLATAERLRRNPRTAAIGILVVSASAQATDLERGRRAGVDAYLTKPFEPADLVRAVTALVERHQR